METSCGMLGSPLRLWEQYAGQTFLQKGPILSVPESNLLEEHSQRIWISVGTRFVVPRRVQCGAHVGGGLGSLALRNTCRFGDPLSLLEAGTLPAGLALPFLNEYKLNPSRRPHEAAAVDCCMCGTVRRGTSTGACIEPGAGSDVFPPRHVLGIRPVRSCASAQRD